MRPDPRLLLPLTVATRPPIGTRLHAIAPVLSPDDRDKWWELCPAGTGLTLVGWTGRDRECAAVVPDDDPLLAVPVPIDGGSLAIDLSAPGPDRVDPLPWALGVLGWADTHVTLGTTGWHARVVLRGDFTGWRLRCVLPREAVDMTGLPLADRPRAVVAAALRQGVTP